MDNSLSYQIVFENSPSSIELINALMGLSCVKSVNLMSKYVIKSQENAEFYNIESIEGTLIKLSILPHHCGFKYLLSAILYYLKSSEEHIAVTKVIYPDIAKKYNATPEKVERCIRHVIDYSWKHSGRKCFEAAGCPMEKKPTNSQFISLLSEYIKTHTDLYT